jgi:hypothetical protein
LTTLLVMSALVCSPLPSWLPGADRFMQIHRKSRIAAAYVINVLAAC